jgi:hypothetical protein
VTLDLHLPDTIAVPEGFVAEVSANKRVAISRDGLQIAYNISAIGAGGNPISQKFFLRLLNQLEPKVITAASGAPFFSPDGQWLGALGSGPGGVLQLRKVSPGGGAPVTLCAVEVYVGATWADDDTIYFIGARPGPVMRIPGAGGMPQEAVKVEFAKAERSHQFPCAIPGSTSLLFAATAADTETFDDARIVVVDTKNGRRKTLVEGGTHPRYSPSGHLVYARGGNLLAVRFDPDRLAVQGQPFTVLEGVNSAVSRGREDR